MIIIRKRNFSRFRELGVIWMIIVLAVHYNSLKALGLSLDILKWVLTVT